jgi:hypothetical protein
VSRTSSVSEATAVVWGAESTSSPKRTRDEGWPPEEMINLDFSDPAVCRFLQTQFDAMAFWKATRQVFLKGIDAFGIPPVPSDDDDGDQYMPPSSSQAATAVDVVDPVRISVDALDLATHRPGQQVSGNPCPAAVAAIKTEAAPEATLEVQHEVHKVLVNLAV